MRINLMPFKNSSEQLDHKQNSFYPLSPKCYHTPRNHNEKRAFAFPEQSPQFIEESNNSNGLLTTEEDSINRERLSSRHDSQTNSKCSGNRLFFHKKQGLQIKMQRVSPLGRKNRVSPEFRQERVFNNHFIPVCSTLKNMMQNKTDQQQDRSFKNYKFCNTQTYSNKESNLNPSCKINLDLNEIYIPKKNIQNQYKILLQQNAMLRNELNEIRKELLLGVPNKKEENISNMRNTIMKEESQIKQLRLKLNIVNKKNILLSNLLQSKEEQNRLITCKLVQLEAQLKEYKEINVSKMQKLKEKVNLIVKSYNQLEFSAGKQEIQWLVFIEKWYQQKSLYMHRIKFLQEYISQSS